MKPGGVFRFWLIMLSVAWNLARPGNVAAQNRPLGTDVSSFQGSNLNWTTIKSDGIYFAWTKAAEGTASDGYIGEDKDFVTNEYKAHAAGVLMGAYYFARPSADPNITGSSSADSEAQFFWSVAGNYIKAGGTNLVPMLDWEDPYVTNVSSLTTSQMSAWLNEWCNDVSNYARAAGVVLQPVVYTGSWYSEPGTYPGLNSTVTNWPTWVAAYPYCTDVNGTEECGDPSPETDSPSPAYPWNNWNIWQYGDTNWSGGDADVFNGTTNQFLELFVVGAQIPTTAAMYWDPGNTKSSPGSGGSGNWDEATSNWWYGGSADSVWPPNGADAYFGGTAGTVTLVDEQEAGSLTFATGGYNITGTSETLYLTGNGNISIPSGATEAINAVLGGAALNLSGGGTLILSNANNYTDGETVTGPGTTLELPTDHPSGNDGVTVNLFSGGAYVDLDSTSGDEFLLPGCTLKLNLGGGIISNPNGNLTLSNLVSGTGSLTFTGGSGHTLTLTDTGNSYSGGTIVSGPGTLEASAAGTLGSTSGKLTVNGGTLNLNGASDTVGIVSVGGGTIQNGTLTGTYYTVSGTSETINAVLAGNGALTNSAGTLTLTGANTYKGITAILGGEINISNDNNLGTDPSSALANAIYMNNGGMIRGQNDSFTLNANRGITLGSGGGGIQLQSGQTITYNGIITGSGQFSAGSNITTGYGTLILGGANTYTGGTLIACGTLELGASGSLPFGTPMVIASSDSVGGAFNMNGHSQTIGPLSSSTGIGGAGTVNPSINLTGALTINETNNTTFAGIINSSGGSLALTGGAELILTGANTYTGATTITSGALGLGGSGSINDTTQINIAAGGTFDVSAISAYTLGSSTTLAASGGASAATIYGGTTVNLGSQPIVLTYGGIYPALTVSQGTLALNGNPFTVNGAVLIPGTYTIVQQSSGNISSSGSFSVTGTALGASGVGSISVSNGSVLLTVFDNTATTLNTLNPSTYGQLVTFTATVNPPPSSGTVQFYINGNAVGNPVSVSGGTASYSTSALAVGSYSITASYSGTTGYSASSTSSASTQQVNAATLDITADAQSKVYGTVLNFGPGSTNFMSSGLENGDTVGSVTLAVSGNGGASNAPVGTYVITPSAATGGTFSTNNYSIVYLTNALTVTLPPNSIQVTITCIMLLTNGNVQMNFSGTPGYVYYIESTTNLTQPINWTIIGTNAADTNGNFSFTDTNASNFSTQYYQTAAQ